MKKSIIFIIVALLTLASCSTERRALNQMRNLTHQVETKGEYYDVEDWQKAYADFRAIDDRMDIKKLTNERRMRGLVVRNTGFWYMVLPEGKCLREESLRFAQAGFDDGHPVADSLVPCKVKGNFRLKGIRTTNPVAVGDVVNYEMNREGFAFINRIETRRNYIIRRSSNLSKQAHILASNLDQVMLILTVASSTS